MIRTGACLYPVHWMSKKQTSIARSTTEAELIALATAMFSQVENLQAVLETILGIDVPVLYQQDNSTLLAVLKTGYSAKLRHANRVHRVNIASVCAPCRTQIQLLIARQMNNAQTVSQKSCHRRNGQLHLNKSAFCLTLLLLLQHPLSQLNLLTVSVPNQT